MQGGSTTEFGRDGEGAAAAFLQARGYEILSRNFYYHRAEIDILARKDTWLVVVEVKTRTGGFYEALTESVPRTKIRRLTRAAHAFVRNHGLELEVRFDIVQVIRRQGEFRCIHTPDAFYFF